MISTVVGVLSPIVGVILLARHLVLRRGKRCGSRDWVHYGEYKIRMNMLTWPSAGLGLVGLGAAQWGEDNSLGGAVLLGSSSLFLILALFNMLQVRVPVWFLPSWARGSVRGRRAAEKRGRNRAAQEKRARRATDKERARR